MRLIWITSPLFLLWSCKDSPLAVPHEKQEPKVSYSTEVRPLVIENCLSCHADLPLHDPSDWDLLHQHKEGVETPEIFKKWAELGSKIDTHWAELPLRKVSGKSVDDFVEASPELTKPREAPQAMFSAPVTHLIAGDLMEDKSRTVSTGYLRRGDDTPQWRAELAAKEFTGTRIDCAQCHDHPSEPWTTAQYAHFAGLFTTPFDHLEKAIPPLFIQATKDETQKRNEALVELKEASKSAPPIEQDYLDWLARDEGLPSLQSIVAAYSFDDDQLHNLASGSSVTATGIDLTPAAGAHGKGLLFNGENKLILTGLPDSSELGRFTISAWIKLEPGAEVDTAIATIGTRERGFEFRITDGKMQARWTRFWPQMSIAVTSEFALLIPGRWAHVAVSYDGSRQSSGLKIHLNGLPINTEAESTHLMKTVVTPTEHLTLSGKGLTIDELQVYQEALTAIEIRHVFDGTSLLTAYQNGDDLREFYQNNFRKNKAAQKEKIRMINERLLKMENKMPAYLVMAANPNQKSDLKAQGPSDRLAFAENLNQDLLARSLANEVWKRHFGAPLVQSLGHSDPLPSQPELLEWLAGKLKESDFNVAQLGITIRNSQTWKQEWVTKVPEAATCPRPDQ